VTGGRWRAVARDGGRRPWDPHLHQLVGTEAQLAARMVARGPLILKGAQVDPHATWLQLRVHRLECSHHVTARIQQEGSEDRVGARAARSGNGTEVARNHLQPLVRMLQPGCRVRFCRGGREAFGCVSVGYAELTPDVRRRLDVTRARAHRSVRLDAPGAFMAEQMVDNIGSAQHHAHRALDADGGIAAHRHLPHEPPEARAWNDNLRRAAAADGHVPLERGEHEAEALLPLGGACIRPLAYELLQHAVHCELDHAEAVELSARDVADEAHLRDDRAEERCVDADRRRLRFEARCELRKVSEYPSSLPPLLLQVGGRSSFVLQKFTHEDARCVGCLHGD